MNKLFVSAAALAAIATVASTSFAGGGGTGFRFQAVSNGLACVSADGTVAPALSSSATFEGKSVRLAVYEIDVTESFAYLTGEQSGERWPAWVSIPVRRGDGVISPAGEIHESNRSTFQGPSPDEISAIATFTRLFTRDLATRWTDDKTIEIETPFSAEGLCADPSAKVTTSFTF